MPESVPYYFLGGCILLLNAPLPILECCAALLVIATCVISYEDTRKVKP
jgi:hypothetical protein